MSVHESISLAEQALRELVEEEMSAKYGRDWYAKASIAAPLISKWQRAKERDRANRSDRALDDELIAYSDLAELGDLILSHWTHFEKCLLDKNRMAVYFERLRHLRNPAMHSRALLNFERMLAEGISGEIRNLVTLYRTEKDEVYYPRIEQVTDSLGNTTPWFNPNMMVSGAIINSRTSETSLRLGDVIEFDCRGWDPDGLELEWALVAGSRGFHHPFSPHRIGQIDAARGDSVTLRWHIKPDQVSERCEVVIYLRSAADYHKYQTYDDSVNYVYRVLPPKGRRFPAPKVEES